MESCEGACLRAKGGELAGFLVGDEDGGAITRVASDDHARVWEGGMV